MADINDSVIDWQFGDFPPASNLLTGKFKSQPARTESNTWLPVVGIAAITAVLLFAYLQISSNLYSQQIEIMGSRRKVPIAVCLQGVNPRRWNCETRLNCS